MLRDIKNDMIGSADTKLAYFDRGLIETVVPLLNKQETSGQIKSEILTILNSFLFDCPKAVDTLRLFKDQLLTALKSMISVENTQVSYVFRLLRSLLKVKILNPSDLESESEILATRIAQTVQLS